MLLSGLSVIFNNPLSLIWVFIGVIVGIIFGAIPGLSATMAIAIFLPITYSLTTTEGMGTMMGLYIGGISGGLISAILLNIPGTPSSVATCFDGRPLALKGQADKALGVGILFSFVGTLIGIVALIFISPVLASLAIKFGPQEYFAVALFSVVLIVVLSSENMIKGLMTGVLGLILSTVGMDPVVGMPRFTLGTITLKSGFNILTVLVGLYAISEVLNTCTDSTLQQPLDIPKVKMRGFGITMTEFIRQLGNAFRSAMIGLGIGILPGIGGGTSNLIAYTVAKSQSKTPEKFGKGEISGLVASETANNATIGGAMIPLLTLGIPGDTTTAMVLGGLMIHGIIPGPLIFETHGNLMYAIFIFMLIASFLMLIVETLGIRAFVKVLTVPKNILMPLIVVLCVIGAFGTNNRIFDVGAIIFFGIIGYFLNKLDFPLPPLVLGFILGGTLEMNLRRGLSMTNDRFLPFLLRPISGIFILLTFLFLVFSIYKQIKRSNK
ncbi:tripartite tricarboxylate transporter permease [Treponema socranskii]|uniref:Tripartite tricarboxylate transporter TctA family protein n=1 Tax=Treponema socranskii subsp. socranskii VPI DR56BR1116 = ATCC 35536 TaxID=1125725 RepID=U2LI36_TRESO|nr:tripartite tricarboxylate transporter permease [Treponema socranskii]ERF60329.1 tripartite tricarboxylate transporter TctA family protein [Treponema socranskii subsp. socranskii VPI DR56BR1116 = ATCC 35536]ERK04098.1 tripartite tricarboxylate transporter TctA family protein [Treponema socranskii subsp. socranskii VPI DR56BR1116 = ATCC 35536]MDR9858753.1 tripartite tricarboxylate transporter permease [Treponema socranskii]